MKPIDRIAWVVAGVVAGAARDAWRNRLLIVDDETPEAALLLDCLARGGLDLPIERVARGAPGARTGAHDDGSTHPDPRRAVTDGALLLNPANKTVAVLWPETLAEPVLPLADLYASRVALLGGDWSAPPHARETIGRAGGIEAVDAFLTAHLEERRSLDGASALLDPAGRAEMVGRLTAGWWWRRRLGVVPKLGGRTLGIDFR